MVKYFGRVVSGLHAGHSQSFVIAILVLLGIGINNAYAAPVVTITSPVNGSAFTAGSNVTITATASETGGTISKVAFYNGTTLLGTVTSNPYIYIWNKVPAGNYSLTAVATDANGVSTTSSSVTLTVATAGEIVDNTDPNKVIITGAWTASTAIAGYYGTNYINDGNALKGTKSVKYTPSLSGGAGSYQVYIRYTADPSRANNVPVDIIHSGITTTVTVNQQVNGGTWNLLGTYNFLGNASGEGVTIRTTSTNGYVIADALEFTQLTSVPVVTITNPANQSTFAYGSNINVTASASETIGTISKVAFYNGTTLLGTSSSSPYSYTWNNVPAGNYSLTAVATDASGVSTTSNPVTITVSSPVAPLITTQPVSVTTTAGLTATFSVVATGIPAPTYQWWSSVNGGAFTVMAGQTNPSRTTGVLTTASSGNRYECVVTNVAGSVTSNIVTLTVNPAVAPSITTQPTSQTVTAPATATFIVAASGAPAPTYQWQQEASGATTYTTISGATSASYTTPATATANSGTKYECVVTNLAGNVTSNAATLTVNPASVAPLITTQPVSVTTTAGLTATFSLVATGIPAPTYQWWSSVNGGAFTVMAGQTNPSRTTGVLTTASSGNRYECVVTNIAGSVTSNVVTLTVNPLAAPTLNTATAGNSNVALSWTAVTGATGYSVQYGTVSGVYQAVSVGNVTSSTVTGLINGTKYYFVVAAVNAGGTGTNSTVMSAVPVFSSISLNYSYDDLNRMTNEQRAPVTTAYYYDEVGNITSEITGALPNTTIILDTTAPSTPGNLTASAINSHQVNLTWTASTDKAGVFGYIIYRDGFKVATTTLTSFSDLSLVSGTMYSYTIRAMDATGNLSGSSTTTTLTTP